MTHPFFERFLSFTGDKRLADLPMPTRKTEEFRFFDVRRIVDQDWNLASADSTDIEPWRLAEARDATLVVRNGVIDPTASHLVLPAGAHVAPLSALPDSERAAASDSLATPLAGLRDDPFRILNEAVGLDPICIVLAPGTEVATPIHVLYVASGDGSHNAPRLLVLAGAGAKATIIEDFRGDDRVFTNAVSELVLGEQAAVNHVRVQREGAAACHVSRVTARVGAFARYDSVHITLGAMSSRNDVWVSHEGEDGWSRIDGLAMVDDEREADTHSVIDNTRVRCESHQLHKCIVDDRGHAVFNGKIFVRHGAQHIDAYQLNRNLLLSNRAKIDTKPQLEIFADDVRCTHGATVGQLDDEQVFYLQSRGMAYDDARATLTYAFAAEVIESIAIPSLASELARTAYARTMQRGAP